MRATYWDRFQQVWLVDFEFSAPEGERPHPICLVAREYRTGREIRLWEDELRTRPQPPYPTDGTTLFVAYYASAEVGCHLALGWPVPEAVLDLYAEFRNRTNGRATPCGWSLLGALAYFGLDSLGNAEKREMQELALGGGPYTLDERRGMLDYCASDVDALYRLLPRIQPELDLPRALLRGRYMVAAARMEWAGIPLDTEQLAELTQHWDDIQEQLIRRIDQDFSVYEGRSFREKRFAEFLAAKGIPWPRHASDRLRMDDETFREQSRLHPILKPLRELRTSLSQMRLHDLAVGSDGRNRCLLSAFRSRTGRNQPSNSRFIFGAASWVRGLVRPEAGRGLAYIDWSQQEFGIAAALSDDLAMIEAYTSGDPYLAFARQAGAAPPSATADSHAEIRSQFKAATLAVQYGMGAEALAGRIKCDPIRARQLLDLHRRTYPTFWRWSDAVESYAMLHGSLWTVFGWTLHVGAGVNPRSLRNFPMQANGAEMLRLACCLATESGVQVCAPVHDAILVEAPLEELPRVVEATRSAMAEASRVVLGGFQLETTFSTIPYPERFMDERGTRLWSLIMETLMGVNGQKATCGQRLESNTARSASERAQVISLSSVAGS